VPQTYIRATEIDSSSIYNNLKTFLRSFEGFEDYNFDAGTLGMLLSILGQNTYYGALYDNFVMNEAFIDSSQLRDSTVSQAKLVGYVPRSAKSAKMYVNLTVTPDDNPDYVTMARGTRFSVKFNNDEYFFVSTKDVVFSRQNNGSWLATNVELAEGFILTHRFVYSSVDRASFTIPNQNVDTDSILVSVQESASSTEKTDYKVLSDLSRIDGDSTVFYVEEDLDQKFRVYFGDGVLGKALSDGNLVIIEYRVCRGSVANYISSVTLVDTIDGYTDVLLSVVARATGGQDIETQESVRFHAPRYYSVQNRVVVEDDYTEILTEQFSDIDSIATWGGQKNDPPLFGKTCIAVKPVTAMRFTNQRKLDMIAALKRLNVMSIDPVIFDPTFTYLQPSISVEYDPSLTVLTTAGIFSKVQTIVQAYETDHLSKFLRSFAHSKFLKAIDDSDSSIITTTVSLNIQKRITPLLNTVATYTVDFNQALYHPYDGYLPILKTTGLYISSSADMHYLDDDGRGNIRLYKRIGGVATYVQDKVGTINYTTGKIVINRIALSAIYGTELKFSVVPQSQNVVSQQQNILLFSDTNLTIYNYGYSIPIQKGEIVTNGTTLSQFDSGLRS